MNNLGNEEKIAIINRNQAIITALISAIAAILTVFINQKMNPKPTFEEAREQVVSELNNKVSNKKGDLYLETLPIGSIIASSLTFEQFCIETSQPIPNHYNPTTIKEYSWIPADGREVYTSRYSTINHRVIDLRGVFLRGRNTFDASHDVPLSIAQKDPDGLRDIGNLQSDVFARHNHGGGAHTHTFKDAYDSEGNGNNSRLTHSGNGERRDIEIGYMDPAVIIKLEGGAETRPKNVAVNYYIKIN